VRGGGLELGGQDVMAWARMFSNLRYKEIKREGSERVSWRFSDEPGRNEERKRERTNRTLKLTETATT